MKVIGLIGGMSWNSTAEYYRVINELIADKLGGLHSARLVLFSVDFDEVERAQHEARWADAASILVEAGSALKRAGADFLVICTNTMHRVAQVVEEKAGLPVLDIIDETGQAITRQGLRRVGLLGTRFVMEEPFYRGRLQGCFDIQVLVPGEDERAKIHQIIYDELCRGTIKASSRYACIDIVSGLIGRGAQGIILGCTELALLIQAGDASVPLFDTSRLHAEAAVNLALTGG